MANVLIEVDGHSLEVMSLNEAPATRVGLVGDYRGAKEVWRWPWQSHEKAIINAARSFLRSRPAFERGEAKWLDAAQKLSPKERS